MAAIPTRSSPVRMTTSFFRLIRRGAGGLARYCSSPPSNTYDVTAEELRGQPPDLVPLVDRRRGRWGRRWLGARGVDQRVRGMALGLRRQRADRVDSPSDHAMAAACGSEETQTSRLDLGGALAATAGLALLVYGLTSAGDRGLGQLSSWLPLLLAATAFVIFVRHEQLTADPLLPPGLLRSRPVAGANLTTPAITASTTPVMCLSVLYVQDMLGVPARLASLLSPPSTWPSSPDRC
jgi:hypothetical protein